MIDDAIADSRTVYTHATFSVVPSLFYQLFTIFVKKEDFLFPVVFVLMTRKTTELYTTVFGKVKKIASAFVPEHAMADYETASVKGLCTVYGSSVTISGCWFHYTQAVGRQARKIGLAIPYRADATVRKCVTMLMSLPFHFHFNFNSDTKHKALLPAEAINEALDILAQYVPLITTTTVNASVRALVTYVKKQ